MAEALKELGDHIAAGLGAAVLASLTSPMAS